MKSRREANESFRVASATYAISEPKIARTLISRTIHESYNA